jgi:hypothetical protein
MLGEQTHGRPEDPSPVQLQIQQVLWENEKSVMWDGGRIVHRVGEGAYKPDSPSGTT